MNRCWLLVNALSIDRKKIDGWISGTMAHRHLLLLAFLITGFLAFFSLPASAGYPPMVPTLQPYRVISPQGKWRLDVTPSNRQGSGPATTTLTNVNTGEIAWKQTLPYTFWQSCVNEEGIVGGYAYTGGVIGGEDGKFHADHFIISFLDAKGLPMHEEKTLRQSSLFSSMVYGPNIYALELRLDAENDRMILLMRNESFRCYSMRNGMLESAFLPEQKGDAFGYESPDEIRFIPNTRLMLLQSNSARGSDTEMTSSSCIQLIDEDGRTVWAASQRKFYGAEKEWPFPEYRILNHKPSVDENDDATADPFAVVADPFSERDPQATLDEFKNIDETLEFVGPPAPSPVTTFEVYFGDTEEKAVFQIFQAGVRDCPSDYRVAEISRENWKLPKEALADEDPAPPNDFPVAKSKRISAIPLKRADGSPLTSIVAVALGPEQQIYAVDEDKGHVHVFSRDGKYLHVCDPGEQHKIETNGYSASLAVDDKGEVFARIAENYSVAEKDRDPLSGHYLRFSPVGKLKAETLAPPSAEFGGKLFVQPISQNLIFFGFGKEVAVNRRDQYGSREVTLTHRADGLWLDFIRDVTCAPDGSIAVRDSSQGNESGGFTTPFPILPQHLPAETVTIYDEDGKPVRTLDFTRYAALTEIAFDGKHIVATVEYGTPNPIIYVLSAHGLAVGSIEIEELLGKENVDLRAFIVAGGKEILAVDQVSGTVYRYEMP
jgi:hypothetical protein